MAASSTVALPVHARRRTGCLHGVLAWRVAGGDASHLTSHVAEGLSCVMMITAWHRRERRVLHRRIAHANHVRVAGVAAYTRSSMAIALAPAEVVLVVLFSAASPSPAVVVCMCVRTRVCMHDCAVHMASACVVRSMQPQSGAGITNTPQPDALISGKLRHVVASSCEHGHTSVASFIIMR